MDDFGALSQYIKDNSVDRVQDAEDQSESVSALQAYTKQNLKEGKEKKELTPSDLTYGENYLKVDRFLKSRYGIDEIDKYSKQEKVDKFLNTMRYLNSGNTLQTASEIDHILGTTEEGRQTWGEGIMLFEQLGGMFGGGYSRSEVLDAARDYVSGAVVDPANLLGPIVGKAAVSLGSKSTSKLAIDLAKRAYTKSLANGASKQVATQAANKVRAQALKKFAKKNATRDALTEIGVAAATDTAIAIGTDLAYQNGLIMTNVQEEVNPYQTGLAALGGIIGGGISAAGVAVRGVSDAPEAALIKEMSVEKAADLSGVLKDLSKTLRSIPEDKIIKYKESFKRKTLRGTELEIKDTEFFRDLIIGNDELGYKGLAHSLLERGFVWRGKRVEGDNFGNWLADAMKNAPEKEVANFMKDFEQVFGVKITGKKGTAMETLADDLALKASQAGVTNNALSQASKILRRDINDITYDDYVEYLFGGGVRSEREALVDKAAEAVIPKKVGEVSEYFQGSYLRLLVSHPGTSALNVAGWGAKSSVQSAADLARATMLYGSSSAINTLLLGPKGGKADFTKLVNTYKANIYKARNLIDPYTTIESFNQLVQRNPDAFRDLTEVLPGGVLQEAAKKTGVETEVPLYQQLGNKSIDAIQTVGLVKAQDIFTKSQEYLYNLDVQIVENFEGMNLRQLMSREDAAVLMNSERYKKAHEKAMGLTLENIMSKSYKNVDNKLISEPAAIIEDFRKIPVVGALIPFGRFFNNTIATMGEWSGAAVPAKLAGLNPTDKSYGELVAKPAVFWTAVTLMADREKELIERGIGPTKDVDESTGEVIDYTYDAPSVYLKLLARNLAYRSIGDGKVPEEFVDESLKIFTGQLTRQLTASETAIKDLAEAVLSGESEEMVNKLSKMMESAGPTMASGYTRFLEPFNVGVALFGSPENYTVLDTNQGSEAYLKSLRYIDQFVFDTIKETSEAKQSATSEVQTRTPGKMFGRRTSVPLTAASRVFGMIGRPEWDTDIKADSGPAANAMKEVFRPIFEMEAQKLLDTPQFINAPVDKKRKSIKDALENSRKLSKLMMEKYLGTNSKKLGLLYSMTSRMRVDSIDKYLEELGYDKGIKLEELSIKELEILDYYIKNEEERLSIFE